MSDRLISLTPEQIKATSVIELLSLQYEAVNTKTKLEGLSGAIQTELIERINAYDRERVVH